MQSLGISVEGAETGRLVVHGKGLDGLSEPAGVLDLEIQAPACGSWQACSRGRTSSPYSRGTGISSSGPWPGSWTRSGRWGRSSTPLRREVRALAIRGGGGNLRPLEYASPVASAQVKSALLLCGLYADGATSVTEPHKSRDHTERMLRFFGVDIQEKGLRVSVQGRQKLRAAGTLQVPSDISSAAFFMVAAVIVPGSDILIKNVGVNPTRTGVIDILKQMGANITLDDPREQAGEPVADIRVRSGALRAVRIEGEVIPRAIDEIPILSVAAAYAAGTTVIKDAAELRVKESDRIAAMAAELRKMGAPVKELPDGMEITGAESLAGAVCESHGDHRIAMSLAVAGLAARGETVVRDTEWVETSFPGFERMLKQVAY